MFVRLAVTNNETALYDVKEIIYEYETKFVNNESDKRLMISLIEWENTELNYLRKLIDFHFLEDPEAPFKAIESQDKNFHSEIQFLSLRDLHKLYLTFV